jgi:hypothetical protein
MADFFNRNLTFPGKRGKRHPQNMVVLRQQRSNEQFSITIPSGVAKALRLSKGETFVVFIDRGDIVLRMVSGK